MKNSEKADVFFKVATELLNLEYCERSEDRQTVIITNNGHAALAPYICDCVGEIVSGLNWDLVTNEMFGCGMTEFGFGVWNHIEEGRRQEARWFFLMLMVEYLDNEADIDE